MGVRQILLSTQETAGITNKTQSLESNCRNDRSFESIGPPALEIISEDMFLLMILQWRFIAKRACTPA